MATFHRAVVASHALPFAAAPTPRTLAAERLPLLQQQHGPTCRLAAAWTHAAWPGGGLKCHLLIRPDYEAYTPTHKYTIALPSLTCSLICLPSFFSQANNSCRLHWQFILAQSALLRHRRRPKDPAALTCLLTAMTPYCDLWNVNAWRSGTHTGPRMHVTRLGWSEKLN